MLNRIKRFSKTVFELVNYDFCPLLNKYVYWLKQPIGWVVAAILFSLLVGLFIGPQGYVMALAFFALLVLGLVWPWLSMKGIRCRVSIPDDQMKENESGEVVLSVRNYWPIPVFGLIVKGDFLQRYDANEELIAFSLKRVPALSNTEFPVSITPRRRGILPAGEVQMSNGFPFGLMDVSKPVLDIESATVWPQCKSLQGNPPAEGNLFNLVGSLTDRSGNDGETIGVRCYREGDRLRNIHWAQTVRSQNLMVRERQTPASTVATILLDLTPNHHSGSGVDSSFEWAIRLAASICFQLHQTNSSVRIVCVGLQVGATDCVANHRGIDGVMDFLASLPTLETQKELPAHEVARSYKSWSRSTQTFFVCTSGSTLTKFTDSSIASIVLELSGFEADEPTIKEQEETLRPGSDSRQKETFHITAPRLAPNQLESAWRRSFGHATR